MKTSKLLAISALAFMAASAFADTYTGALNLQGGNALFGRGDAVGSFVDSYSFSLASGALVGATVSSADSGPKDLDFTSATIENSAHMTVATFTGTPGSTDNDFLLLAPLFLAADAYTLIVTGINSVDQAPYAGTMAITAVPEADSTALMLAGLGALALVSRRRKGNLSA
jgi:MYXO-CTERM domain-containing protein